MEKTKPQKPKGLYNKYTILNAKTGAVKRGKYFVLRLDSKNADERACVACALKAYADKAQQIGTIFDNATYSKLSKDIASMLSDVRDEWVAHKPTKGVRRG